MTTWERAPEALWRRSGERRILMGPTTDEVLVVEGTGRAIWDLLGEPCTQEELVGVLAEGFDARPEEVSLDVREFLGTLRDAGLVIER